MLILLAILFLILPQSPASTNTSQKSSHTLTGTYVLKLRKGAGGTLQVRQLNATRIEFNLEVNRGAPSYNSGIAHGTIDVTDGIAVYRINEYGGPCRIRFDFSRNSVKISQNGGDLDCGFGHGVTCDGSYRLVSRKPPKFKERD